MYDYVDGKVDWMAFGLPVEGEDGPFLGDQVADVPTCDVRGTVADARQVLTASGADVVVLVDESGMALGDVEGDTLHGETGDVRLLDVLRPVPSTVRPSVTVSSVAEGGGGTRLVTTSDGRLLGQATVAAGEHDHDHDHDHDEDEERYDEEIASVMKALEERFAGREPSDEEVRAFLRDRMVAEGRSEEEADSLLAEMGEGAAG